MNHETSNATVWTGEAVATAVHATATPVCCAACRGELGSPLALQLHARQCRGLERCKCGAVGPLHHGLCSTCETALVASLRGEPSDAVAVRTAEEIARTLAHTSRNLLDRMNVDRVCVTVHGEVAFARRLERDGLIVRVGHVASLHQWRITETGREVAKAVAAERWAASCAGKAVA